MTLFHPLLAIALCTSTIPPQGSTVHFTLRADTAHTADALGPLQLPVSLEFTSDFDAKAITLRTDADPTTVLVSTTFGRDGDIGPTETTGSFAIGIGEDRRVDVGTGPVVDMDRLILEVANGRFSLSLAPVAVVPPVVPVVPVVPVGPAAPSGPYVAGYLAYDAIKLADAGTADAEVAEILEAYGVKNTNITGNLYLNDELGTRVGGLHGGAVPFLAALGQKDITPFLSGFARFLAQRTKEELNEAFFRRMKERLNAYPELGTVFPKTTAFLNVIETYAYASVLQVLKEAFETDVRDLPTNLYQVKDLTSANCSAERMSDNALEDCKTRLDNLHTYFTTRQGQWVSLAMLIAKDVMESTDPATLLTTVVASQELDDLQAICASEHAYNELNVTAGLELADLLSQSLLSKEDEHIWIGPEQLKRLFQDDHSIKIYLGLLLAKEQYGGVKILFHNEAGTPMSFGDVLLQAHADVAPVVRMIKQVCAAFTSTDHAASRIQASTEHAAQADAQALHGYYRTFVSTVTPIVQSDLMHSLFGSELKDTYLGIIRWLDPAVDLVYHVGVQQYSSAVHDAVLLLNGVKEPVLGGEATTSLLKYGTFIGSVAGAQSSDEVKSALEASLLPVGSSSIKRYANWSISLNAYVGAYYGQVTVNGKDTVWNVFTNALDTISRPYRTSSYGLYAPIGVSFCKGTRIGLGFSLTAQLIDLGALVNFYLIEGDATALPENFTVRLANVFAPGLQLGINIPRTPLSILGGYQYVPALYERDQITSSSEIVASNASRWHISLVVDLPLLNVHVTDFKK